MILNFTGSKNLSMFEVNEASEWLNSMITNASSGRQANIIWGIGVDETLEDCVRVTVVATGFGGLTDGGRQTRGRGSRRTGRLPVPVLAERSRQQIIGSAVAAAGAASAGTGTSRCRYCSAAYGK